MVGALWTGISGLGGSQIGLDNESNNIANVNTIGYKASRVSFADQMYQDKIGKGVTSFDVEKMYTQGNLKRTGVSNDMALSGDGFFQVKDGADTYYTRAGNFRRGEGGTLEDVGQNKVQGWAIQPVTSDDIISTDPNAQFFTNDFSELLGNKMIRDTTSIETIAAKATDYRSTAETDNLNVFTGAGYKSASTKIADITALRTEYNAALSVYAEADPKPTASNSTTQKELLDFDTDNATTILAEGDEVYVYIDGERVSQNFEKDELTTMQKFADLISDKTGYKAYLANTTSSDPYNADPTSTTGEVIIEGLIPGKGIRISEFGWTDRSEDNKTTKGDLVTLSQAVLGTGMGHINSIRDALSEAVSGKQMDVYDTDTIVFDTVTAGLNDFTYQMEIYDKTNKETITVPSTGALTFTDVPDLDTFVANFNNPDYPAAGQNTLTKHVKAYNFNGNLVIKTLNDNYDVEFTGTLTAALKKEEQIFTVGAPAAGASAADDVEFFGTDIAVAAGDSAEVIAAKIYAERETIINAWNAAQTAAEDAYTQQIESITLAGDKLTVTFRRGSVEDDTHAARDLTDNLAGFVPNTTGATLTFDTTNSVDGGTTETLLRNANYSTREGAGAEFLQIETTINQTASKNELQLRLDTLGITDSAFGKFEVDETGLIIMEQDGTKFAIGQVAVARFTDNRGLEPVGDNLLKETIRSGTALFNIDNDKMAEVKGGTLELSTADLSESLVNLMVFQRAFEANAKSITTADTILNTLIQLKR